MHEDFFILGCLYRMTKELDWATSRISAAYGLTFGQFAVLEALNRKGALNVGEIKETILSSDGTVPVIIGNLIKMGLVTKTKNDEDRRYSIIELTDKGREIIQQVKPKNNQMISDKFSVWTPEEKQILMVLLNKYRKSR